MYTLVNKYTGNLIRCTVESDATCDCGFYYEFNDDGLGLVWSTQSLYKAKEALTRSSKYPKKFCTESQPSTAMSDMSVYEVAEIEFNVQNG